MVEKKKSSGLYHYLLLISPPSAISEDVKYFKQAFKQGYSCNNATYSKPHITLIDFVQHSIAEKKIIDDLERLSRSKAPVDIKLNGFGYFKNGKKNTIYIKVVNSEPIEKIVKEAKIRFKNHFTLSRNFKPSFILKPHITIDKEMSEDQFNKAWREWEYKIYNNTFEFRTMRLIKSELMLDSKTLRLKRAGKTAAQLVREFHLTGNGNSFSQGKLF